MDQLPEELLVRVFNHLNRTDQMRVSLASKNFSRIAMPLLYTNCELAPYETCDVRLRLIRRFLRTTASAAHLATLVKQIGIGEWQAGLPEARQVAPISGSEAWIIVQQIPGWIHYPLPHLYELRDALTASSQDAMTTTMLCMLPNLRTVTFSMFSRCYHEDEYRMAPSFPDFGKTLTMRLFDIATQTSRTHRLPLFQQLSHIFLDGHVDMMNYPESDGLNVALLQYF